MIEIKNLDFSYKKTPVFNNISLRFEPGNIYGLLGENGVGKTTLLKIISGLQKPIAGSCMVDEFTSFERKPQFLQDICFMPDEITVPDLTTPMKYIQSISGFYPKFSNDLLNDLMKEFEVDPMRKFKEMSYGQQKKAMIACSLSLGTRYLLLDEPTNGLDIPSKTQFRKILSSRVNEESTIIISTHQVRDVENLIDPIIILTHDDVLLNASIEEITKKLYFEYGAPMRKDALYCEARPDGCMNVVYNTEGLESQVNIEALFNAVLQNKEAIKSLFNK